MAGVFLFQLYARARWHELGAMCSLVADAAVEDGFLEAEFHTVKTAAQFTRGKQKFTMLSISTGVTSPSWARPWLALRS
eukprot:3434225-Amphidinium_carterae.1